jgi:hypothetical protein
MKKLEDPPLALTFLEIVIETGNKTYSCIYPIQPPLILARFVGLDWANRLDEHFH